MSNDRQAIETRLRKAIAEGLNAADAAKWLLPVIVERRNEIVSIMESDCGKFDTDAVNVPQYKIEVLRAELGLLRRMETGIKTAVEAGNEARAQMNDLDRVREQPPARLRF